MRRRNRGITVIVLAGALCLLLLTDRSASGGMPAYPSLRSGIQQAEDPKKRWERLPEDEKRELLERYKNFKAMPDEEKGRLRERHHKLQQLRNSLDLSASGEGNTVPERTNAETDRRIREFMRTREAELKRRLKVPQEAAQKNRRERVRQLRKMVENINAERIAPFLGRMVKDGLLQEHEADQILALPDGERKKRIFEIARNRLVKEMDGLVPPEDLDRLRRMEPWTFHRWRRTEQERRGAIRPMGRLTELSPEQEQGLRRLPEGEERDRMREELFLKNLRERLGALGVEVPGLEQIRSMPPPKRQQWIMRTMKSLMQMRSELSPEARKFLEEFRDERPFQRRARQREGPSKPPRRP